ncbi:MAG: glycosyltransferase [Crocinitomicaceae bacterium]
MNKKALLITYYWPPAGGPGVQRWLKIVKYLPEYNIIPIVLTVDEFYASYPLIDTTLSNDIHSNTLVYKTKSFEILDFYKKLNKKKSLPASGFSNEQGKTTFIEKIFRAIRGNLFIPDARIGWNKYAYKKAVELINEHQITSVITTGPPHSTHLIGLKLKKKFKNINWFADFRDPWSGIFYNNMLYQTKFAKLKDKKLEQSVLCGADKIITVGDTLKKHLLSNAPISSNKIIVIPNGFDSDDFINVKQNNDTNFKITYLGTANKLYPFNSFLEALSQLSKEGIKIEFEIIGVIDNEVNSILSQYERCVEIKKHPYIEHQLVPEKLVNTNALLLIIPNNPYNKLILTGKLFEYLASKKPIIGLGPVDGDASKVLAETDSGEMFGYMSVIEIKTFIKSIYNKNRVFKFENDKYSRKNQAKNIAELL